MSIFSILLFLIILALLIFVHELGHFLVAKWTGMKVEEFSLGFFKPHIFDKTIGETRYVVGPFLLGGYVKILGEQDTDDRESINPRSFSNKPWWAKFAVLIAGVTMNMLFAYAIFIGLAYGTTMVAVDDPDYAGRVTNERLIINSILPDAPLGKAGVKPGAMVYEIRTPLMKADLKTATSAVEFVNLHQEDAITVTYQNPRETLKASTTVALIYGLIPDKKALGVSLEKVGDVEIGFFESFIVGAKSLWSFTMLTWGGLAQLATSVGKGENVISQLSGPIGIASLVHDAEQVGYQSVLLLTAFLSINLAVLNILPFPALDGGQIVKVTIEAVIRRKLKAKYNALLNGIGFLLLLALLITVSIHDVMKIFSN